jgi:hypothetical protein
MYLMFKSVNILHVQHTRHEQPLGSVGSNGAIFNERQTQRVCPPDKCGVLGGGLNFTNILTVFNYT